ncbi:MAG: hypothetical protein GKC00_00565, partial [Candidatus Methanofastidiosa archaeon]|nr:hypothetical protein [Candidatus Methanofastidiosa archaeon]
LFMPERIPNISKGELEDLREKRYFEVAHTILEKFLYGDIESDHLFRLCKEAYNFRVPIEKVHDRKYVLRLDQGPTASFKDFAARMMARLMGALKDEKKYEEAKSNYQTAKDLYSTMNDSVKIQEMDQKMTEIDDLIRAEYLSRLIIYVAIIGSILAVAGILFFFLRKRKKSKQGA